MILLVVPLVARRDVAQYTSILQLLSIVVG